MNNSKVKTNNFELKVDNGKWIVEDRIGFAGKRMNAPSNHRRIFPFSFSVFNSSLSVTSCLSCLLFFLLASLAVAQSGGTFEIKKSVIASGGGVATGGAFSLDSTIAEPIAGTNSTGGPFSLTGGYRAGSAAEMAANFAVFDFDGDGKTDVSVFRPNPPNILDNAAPEGSSSQWWILKSQTITALGITFGAPSDYLVPADYTGDGKADVAFFRPSDATWYVLRSEDFTFLRFSVRRNR